MHYRTLGASGLQVSSLCPGTMMFGDRTDLAEAGNIVGSLIAGPMVQWQAYVEGIDTTLDDANEVFVDTLAQPGHPLPPGFNDPRSPIVGRSV